jgi:uncharacterized protein
MTRPTLLPNRIHSIDILRGTAILGIGVVNILGFNASFFDFGGFYNNLEDPHQLGFYQVFISLTADKSIFIFSFLFGYGVYFQYRNFGFNEPEFTVFFKRRMFYLALFGIAHIILLWAGDILLLYALAGMFLFFFRKSSERALLFLGVFFYFFISLWLILALWIPLPNALSSTCTECLSDALNIYPEGTYWQCFQLRMTEYVAFRNINLFYYLPKAIGIFFFGFLASKRNFHHVISNNLKASLLFLMLLGTIAALTWHYYEQVIFWAMPEGSRFISAVYMFGYELMNFLVAGFYIMVVMILASSKGFSRLLMPLSYVGRMSLTNYIFQSIVFSILFYGWGFGLFGKQEPAEIIWYAVLLFLLQIPLSYAWLSYFRQGPLEWAWRKLSYKKMK